MNPSTRFLPILLLLFTTALLAQKETLKDKIAGVNLQGEKLETAAPAIDTTFLILGAISDYMGRKVNLKSTDVVDRFFAYEEALYDFIVNHSGYEVELSQKERHVRLLSEALAKKINSFYKFEKGGKSSKDGINWAGTMDGTFKENVLRTPSQKLSYVVGAYARYGEDLGNDIYKIELANSSEKAKVIVDLLNDLGCSHIYFYRNPTLIPVQTKVYFRPTESIKNELVKFDKIMADVKKQKVKFYQKMSGQDFEWPEDPKAELLEKLWQKPY